MIICNIIVIPNKKPRFQKNLSEEDKDMIVNEISLVIQKTPECWNLILVEFTSFGEVLSRGELFLSNPRATSPGRRTNTL